jgi:chemosensory pili system protein ChpA (sensor histidine kinase/response regulator)
MNMRHVQESDTLAWVKSQLDSLVTQARNEIISYFEEEESPEKLAAAQAILAQLRGVLGMVEVHGASMLAQEMEYLILALNEKSVSKATDACDLLLRAFLTLPDYLEQVQLRNRETPHVLLPIINDLRGVRNAEPISKKVLFFPTLDKVMAPVSAPLSGRLGMLNAREVARRTRHLFQLALLGWFQDKDKTTNVAKMQRICSVLYQTAKENTSRNLWWVVNAFLQTLNSGGVESDFTVKFLLGRVDRQIKSLIDHGEQVFVVRMQSFSIP